MGLVGKPPALSNRYRAYGSSKRLDFRYAPVQILDAEGASSFISARPLTDNPTNSAAVYR